MYEIIPQVNKKKVTLFDYTKKIAEFDSVIEFVKTYYKYDVNERLGSEVPQCRFDYRYNEFGFRVQKTWTLVDYYGRILHPDEVKRAYDTYEYRKYQWDKFKKSRQNPRNLGSYSLNRKPRTTSERRQILSFKDDNAESPLKIKSRASRNKLPHAWDDIISSKLHRNWKRYRQHQWNS